MAVLPNWKINAAQTIAEEPEGHHLVERIVTILDLHSPFKDGVAYMPVPRCDSCLHWDNIGSANKYHGVCRLSDHDPASLAVTLRMNTHACFGCVSWSPKS